MLKLPQLDGLIAQPFSAWMREKMTKHPVDADLERNTRIFDSFWRTSVPLYESHPTGRHRRRFVTKQLRRIAREAGAEDFTVFDYGCGSGAVLEEVQLALGIPESSLWGCDIAPSAIELVSGRFPAGSFFLGTCPELPRRVDVVICSEVIEHTAKYETILRWIYGALRPGGWLILTTPSVPMDPPTLATATCSTSSWPG